MTTIQIGAIILLVLAVLVLAGTSYGYLHDKVSEKAYQTCAIISACMMIASVTFFVLEIQALPDKQQAIVETHMINTYEVIDPLVIEIPSDEYKVYQVVIDGEAYHAYLNTKTKNVHITDRP